MKTHTPGPWAADDEACVLAGHKLVADVDVRDLGDNVWDWDTAMANACLIAAAPELLDACKTLLFELTVMQTDAREDVIRFASAAIAKATGAA